MYSGYIDLIDIAKVKMFILNLDSPEKGKYPIPVTYSTCFNISSIIIKPSFQNTGSFGFTPNGFNNV
jgi:hypothetical protein